MPPAPSALQQACPHPPANDHHPGRPAAPGPTDLSTILAAITDSKAETNPRVDLLAEHVEAIRSHLASTTAAVTALRQSYHDLEAQMDILTSQKE